MAKKAAKGTKRKAAKRSAPKRANVTRGKRKAPRPQPLPGMENARIRELDAICQSIAEVRDDINKAKAEDAAYQTTALNRLKKHGKTSWAHAGVTLVRVPGEERLQVRTTRGGAATAETDANDDASQGSMGHPDPDGLEAAEREEFEEGAEA